MSKNQKASGITNIISYDNSGNISFVSGSTTLMSVSSSGAVLLTNTISGGVAVSASLSANSNLLEGTGSVGFATTASLLAVSSSQQQISSSLLTLTASYTALSSSYIALSASYNTFSGSASTRVTQIESVYATTGSNSFRANQSITGSLVVSSTITAQTLVVQTVTSSIVYSSGSNLFGSALGDIQTFTGSLNVTGSSHTIFGNVGIGTTNPTAKLQVAPTNEAFAEGIFVNQAGSNQATIRFKSAHSADSDYRIGASILVNNAFEIYSVNASASRVVLTNSGSVGIGITTPTSPLTLAAASANFAFYNTFNNAQVRNWAIAMNYYNLGDMSFLQSTAQNGNPITAGTARLHLNYDGNVGIGTTNPSYILDVRSSASSGAPIVGNFQSAGGDAQLYVSNGSITTQLTADNTNSIAIVGSITNHPLVIRTNNTERVRVSTAGVTTVKGDAGSLIQQAVTVGSELYFQLWNSVGSRRGYIGYGSNNTAILDFWNAENGDIKFGTNNTEKVRITSAGYVGIGYSNPDAFVASSGYGNLVVGSGAGNQGITIFSGTASSSGLMFADATSGTGAYTGYILYSHLSDKMEIATGGGTPRLTIDSSGCVIKPYQPAFNAGKNTNSSVSAGATVVFQLTTGNKFNIGGHYNASTGIFTAPVAGVYVFSASIIWMSLANGQTMDDSFWIYKNSSIVAYGLRRAEYESTYTGNGGYFVDFANVLLSLAINDTVKVVNNRTLDIHGNSEFSYFYGYLLG